MTRTFKPGDRVAVYCAHLGLRGDKGTILNIDGEDGLYAVKLDQPTCLAEIPEVHPKQLRRLVPQPRRRWTAQVPLIHSEQCCMLTGPALRPGETVEVVETRKGKGK